MKKFSAWMKLAIVCLLCIGIVTLVVIVADRL